MAEMQVFCYAMPRERELPAYGTEDRRRVCAPVMMMAQE